MRLTPPAAFMLTLCALPPHAAVLTGPRAQGHCEMDLRLADRGGEGVGDKGLGFWYE